MRERPVVSEAASSGVFKSGGSVARRIVAAVVAVAAFTILAVGVLFYGFLGRYVVESQKEQMLSHALAVVEQLEGLEGMSPMGMRRGSGSLTLLLRVDLQVLPAGAGINIFDDEGVVASAGPQRVHDPVEAVRLYDEGARLLEDGGSQTADLPASGEGQRLILAAAPYAPTEGGQGLVVVSLPTSEAAAAGRDLLGVLAVSGAIALGLATLVGLALGAWLARPIRRLGHSARTMAAGSYGEPVSGSFSGELYDLAAAMESMRREVRRSEESLRGFVASAAHELRTPLTSIEGFSQALLDGTASTEEQRSRSAAAIFREAGRLRRLVDALLTLSRYDSREYRPNVVSLDASALLREEIERLAEAGLGEPGRVQVRAEGDTSLRTDADMLRQVLANLLRNAIQYGGEDRVEAEVRGGPDRVRIRITNGGEPLGDQERDRLFERFFRGQSHSRIEGFGLGLPLVREITEVLGGSVQLEDGGPGTTFRLTLPKEAT